MSTFLCLGSAVCLRGPANLRPLGQPRPDPEGMPYDAGFPPGEPDQPSLAAVPRDRSASLRWTFLDVPAPDLTLSVPEADEEDDNGQFSRHASSAYGSEQGEPASEWPVDVSLRRARSDRADRFSASSAGSAYSQEYIADPFHPRLLELAANQKRRPDDLSPDDVESLPLSPQRSPRDSLAPPETAPRSTRTSAPRTPPPRGPVRAAGDPPPVDRASVRPQVDLLGRPLPPAPPPQDPFAYAIAQQPSLVNAPRSKFGAAATRRRSFNLAAFGPSRREDDTQSTWASTEYETTQDISEEIRQAAGAAAPSRDGAATTGASHSVEAFPTTGAPEASLRRSPSNPYDLPGLDGGRRGPPNALCLDLPAPPEPVYAPLPPSPNGSHTSDTSARVLRARREPLQAYQLPVGERPSLALRRSAQELPPLRAVPDARPRHLAPPSDCSSPSISSVSLVSSPLPAIERGKDGFYRMPVSPRKVKTPFEDATNLSFPLPPDSEAMAAAIHSAVEGDGHAAGGAPLTPVTPSIWSHPPSPSPGACAAPPSLPDFVSVFLNRRTSEEEEGGGQASESEGEEHVDAYPPSRPNAHTRQAESLSTAVAPPHGAPDTLRLRSHLAPEESPERSPKSQGSSRWFEREKKPTAPSSASGVKWHRRAAPGWSLRAEPRQGWSDAWSASTREVGGWRGLFRSKKAKVAGAVLLVVVLLLIVGLATGLSRRSHSSTPSAAACSCLNGGEVVITAAGDCACSCREPWGGTSCHLDGTCVGGPAQGILDTANLASARWQPEINTTRLAATLPQYFLPSAGGDSATCSAQLAAIAVPNLSQVRYPARTEWIEAALLHTLALSESNSSLRQFRTFASGLDYRPFGDVPATKPNSNFAILSGGYVWDLAVLQRTVQPVSWNATVGATTSGNLSSVNVATLDRITANALAASHQRATALVHYWNDTLGLPAEQLGAFRSAVQNAEVLLPFDASAYTNSSYAGSEQIPPPAACRDGLDAEALARIDSLEKSVFLLPGATNGSTGCQVRLIRIILLPLQLTESPPPRRTAPATGL